MKRTGAIALAIACLLCLAGCNRPTPEEELMNDMQKILQDAYGKDCKVHSIYTGKRSRRGRHRQ